MKTFLRYAFLGILFPLMVQYVFYFQFTPNYTQDLFNEPGFVKFYGSNVYKSRQLGKQIHLWAYHRLNSWHKMDRFKGDSYNNRRLLPLDAHADSVFYLTYFFVSSFFLVLTALLLLFLLDDRFLFPIAAAHRDLVACFLVLLAGFTQFVVTPYDTIGYFFEALGLLLFLKYLKTGNRILYVGLLLTILVATTNRETSLILLSVMAAVYFYTQGIRWSWIRTMILPAICFLLPYLGLKLLPGGNASFSDVSQLRTNLNLLNPWSLMGFLYAAFAIWLMYRMNRNGTRLISAFLFFSLPYLLIIFYSGLTVEYRLWMPLLEGALVLGILDLPALERLAPVMPVASTSGASIDSRREK